jgi:transposase-like protein
VSLVARRYDVNANQVFTWRRRYRAGSAEPAYRVRIGSGVKASALRLVLDVLERR